MLKLHRFFPGNQEESPEEVHLSALRFRLLELLVCFAAGTLYAAALPPLDWSLLAFVTLAPLLYVALRSGWKFAWLCGWVWGIGWSLFAFQFLREIDPVVPYLMAPVISLWPALWAGMLPFLWRNTVFPFEVEQGGFEARREYLARPDAAGRLLLFAIGAAALFTLVEWTRSRLFPWNDLSVTMWRHTALIQIASVTGSYGVMFLVALIGTLLGTAFAATSRFCRWKLFCFGIAVLTLSLLAGMLLRPAPASGREWRPALLQGDISQRRNADIAQAQEALDIYAGLSRQAARLEPKPDIILWPESAVPVPFRATHPVSENFRNTVRALAVGYQTALLIGAIDFRIETPEDFRHPQVTNSALHIGEDGKLLHKYDKIHRVPYGEYIPFRKYLPDFIIRRIDMNRDLAPGTNFNPVELRDDVRAGIAICYEGIFSYVTREFARRGANVLVVLSNDAWYPVSSEPEQHLANAVMRAVETGLPMVRCGNNGGSLVVQPDGVPTQILEVPGNGEPPELRRGRGFGVVTVYPAPSNTFFVRYGEWFIGLLAVGTLLWASRALSAFVRRKRALYLLTIAKMK